MSQYIYGRNAVMQRLNSEAKIHKLYILDNQKDEKVAQLSKKKHINVEYVSRKVLDSLAKGGKHQGIIAEIDEYKTYTLNEVLDSIPEGELPLLVMLDQLEDPHNLGAILRTCDAIGAHGIIIKKNNSVGLTPTVAKVSTGAIETVPVIEVANLSQTCELLKTKGFWIFGTDMDNSVDYRYADYTSSVVLVIGSEGKGISRLVKEHCDQMITIPMVGSVQSLNASVACAICLYEIYNQRNPIK